MSDDEPSTRADLLRDFKELKRHRRLFEMIWGPSPPDPDWDRLCELIDGTSESESDGPEAW